MIIGLLQARLSLPEARSLKDKRSIIKSMRDRVTHHHNVSVAEVGDQDLHRSAVMAFVTVAATRAIAEKRLAEISRRLQSDPRHVLLDLHAEWL